MAEKNNIFYRIWENNIFRFVFAIILVSLVVGGCIYFIKATNNKFVIKKDIYNFQIEAPKGWVAKEMTYYTKEIIDANFELCKNGSGNAAGYELGRFRLSSQKYPDDFGESEEFEEGFSSGVILEIKVGCFTNQQSLSQESTESSYESAFTKSRIVSFSHNNLRYEINENIYISPKDSDNKERLILQYSTLSNNVISSMKFND